jgi:hypothetical protein
VAAVEGRPQQSPHPARDHCLAPARSVGTSIGGHRYTRTFPSLPHLEIDASFLTDQHLSDLAD